MKHSFPPDTPASGHNIGSDLHCPSGAIHPIPHPYPCPQMETQVEPLNLSAAELEPTEA